jgi:hypothetical protein
LIAHPVTCWNACRMNRRQYDLYYGLVLSIDSGLLT